MYFSFPCLKNGAPFFCLSEAVLQSEAQCFVFLTVFQRKYVSYNSIRVLIVVSEFILRAARHPLITTALINPKSPSPSFDLLTPCELPRCACRCQDRGQKEKENTDCLN